MISFSFKGSFIVSFTRDGFEKGFVGGAAFRGLTEITSRIETFFLVGTEAGAEAEAEAGTRGTETEAEAETGVALAMETFGTIGVVGTAETEAKVTLAMGIARTAETRAEAGTGVALGIEAFSYARLNKSSR
jgi:hypothetical protein